jgi:hypothetical protein
MGMRSNKIRQKIKNKDKEGIEVVFAIIKSSLNPGLSLDNYFKVGKILEDLKQYILEECE